MLVTSCDSAAEGSKKLKNLGQETYILSDVKAWLVQEYLAVLTQALIDQELNPVQVERKSCRCSHLTLPNANVILIFIRWQQEME